MVLSSAISGVQWTVQEDTRVRVSNLLRSMRRMSSNI